MPKRNFTVETFLQRKFSVKNTFFLITLGHWVEGLLKLQEKLRELVEIRGLFYPELQMFGIVLV